MVRVVAIGEDAVGQRVDNFIIKHLKDVPRVRVYRAIRQGEVRVNRGRIKPSYRLRLGDQVRIPPLSQRVVQALRPPKTSVQRALTERVIYEDNDLLVLDKPSGLPVHGGSGIQGGVIELLRMIRTDLRFLELIHRLDRETSGCLLFAKKRQSLLIWHELLTQRKVRKQYIALVKGHWSGGQRRIEAPLLKNIFSSGERLVKVDPEGKAATTIVRPLKQFNGMTLVEARPITGRTHQLRVHLAHIGHPIAGDGKYGDTVFNRQLRQLGLKRLFLHAAAISAVGHLGWCIPLELELKALLQKFPLDIRK